MLYIDFLLSMTTILMKYVSGVRYVLVSDTVTDICDYLDLLLYKHYICVECIYIKKLCSKQVRLFIQYDDTSDRRRVWCSIHVSI